MEQHLSTQFLWNAIVTAVHWVCRTYEKIEFRKEIIPIKKQCENVHHTIKKLENNMMSN